MHYSNYLPSQVDPSVVPRALCPTGAPSQLSLFPVSTFSKGETVKSRKVIFSLIAISLVAVAALSLLWARPTARAC